MVGHLTDDVHEGRLIDLHGSDLCGVQGGAHDLEQVAQFGDGAFVEGLGFDAIGDIEPKIAQGQGEVGWTIKLTPGRAVVKGAGDAVKVVGALALPAEIGNALVDLLANDFGGHQVDGDGYQAWQLAFDEIVEHLHDVLVGPDERGGFKQKADSALVHIEARLAVVEAIGQHTGELGIVEVTQCLVGRR